MENIGNLIINSLELPPEILTDMPMLTLHGMQSVLVENFSSLLAVSNERIELQTGAGVLTIAGERLQISFLRQGEMGITGRIKAVLAGDAHV